MTLKARIVSRRITAKFCIDSDSKDIWIYDSFSVEAYLKWVFIERFFDTLSFDEEYIDTLTHRDDDFFGFDEDYQGVAFFHRTFNDDVQFDDVFRWRIKKVFYEDVALSEAYTNKLVKRIGIVDARINDFMIGEVIINGDLAEENEESISFEETFTMTLV